MSLEQTIDNLQIRNANMVTFVGTSNTMVDTTTGRIQTKGIQHNSNVITDVSGPHGRGVATLKKYPEIDFGEGKFDITEIVAGSDQYWDGPSTVFQGGYSLKTTQHSTDSGGQFGWMAFDGNSESLWKNAEDYDTSGNYDYGYTGIQQRLTDTNSTNHDGDHVIMGSPSALKMAKVTVTCKNLYRRVVNYSVLGSNSSGTTGWTLLDSGTFTAQDVNTATISSPTSYFKYHAFVVRSVTTGANGTRFQINSIDFYGYEEDPPAGDHSVDTTFKSRFNNPQTTGVQVLVDGATGVGTNQISGGPDPSGNQSTYVTDGKYWTLNGTLTSNLSVEANTFLEGDQPHALSVWFNSSNLEANVSNTCVFSIASEEKLDSVNLDLQSNTWHNLTYAYQGEGGSRVTYLDGRKVSEDQAEDTFGDYPPFAMTGYSQGGYVVSASNEEGGGRTAYSLFNDVESEGNGWRDTGGTFQAGTGGHYTSNGTYAPATGIPRANLGSDSGGTAFATADEGEWVKIELPYKIKLNYFTLQPRNSTSIANGSNPSLSWGRSEFIKNGKIWGSNDGINWSVVHTISGTSASSDTVINSYTVGSSVAYKYFAIVITATNTSTSYASSTSLSEWKLYGHRENDLVRLPDPTNVLKYPHITMTGPAQRGYVASSNNEYIPDGRLAWKAYDGIDTDGSTNIDAWMTNDPSWTTATPGEPIGTGDLAPDTFTVGGVNYTGHWNKLELPHKIRVSQIYMSSRMSTRLPYKGVFLGSDDDSSWEVIYSFNNTLTWSTVSGVGQATTITGITNTNSYKYVMLVVQQINGSDDRLWLNQIKYYGTGVDSIPIQIGGGNIDKVANFRVYDKFIEEDQVNEIWNAQKDEFGRAKPQMVLQQGKLGIGTDAPQGSLSVADEPHNLEEFPPRAMTDYKTYFEGHGEFCVTASDEHSSNYDVQNAFNKITNRLNSSGGTTNTYYNGGEPTPRYYDVGNDYAYSGTSSTHGLGDVMGEWVKLEFPYKANISQISILPVDIQISTLAPEDFTIMGSSDDVNWTTLRTVTGATWTAHKFNEYTLPSTTSYKYFALVVSRTVGANQLSIQELKYFGTREQGQSILHDGQLTLTKNLDVPRIGPPLDADDTPRRDRLVVEYNTSTNPTFEGAVRDTSGRGLDGIMHTATYNATEKAIESNGNTGTYNNGPGGSASGNTNDYGSFETVLPSSLQGNPVFTVSGWFKQNTIANLQLAWLVARNLRVSANPGLSNKMHWLGVESTGRPRIALGGGGNLNLYYTSGSIKAGIWHHMVVVIEPTGTDVTQNHVRFYLDGVLQTTSNTGSSGTIDLGGGAPPRMHWFWQESSTVYYDGSASNLKLHDCALTAEEVKTLYDMGRMGGKANPQPLHIAAPLYAPGTTVQLVHKHAHDYHTVNNNYGRITPMTLSIKPKFSTSKILVQMMVNGEGHHDATFRVLRYTNGTFTAHMPPDAWQSPANTDGIAPVTYDVDNNSTMGSVHIMFVDSPNTTGVVEYQLYYKVQNGSTVYRFSLNQTTRDSTGNYGSDEHSVSSIVLQEIAQ